MTSKPVFLIIVLWNNPAVVAGVTSGNCILQTKQVVSQNAFDVPEYPDEADELPQSDVDVAEPRVTNQFDEPVRNAFKFVETVDKGSTIAEEVHTLEQEEHCEAVKHWSLPIPVCFATSADTDLEQKVRQALDGISRHVPCIKFIYIPLRRCNGRDAIRVDTRGTACSSLVGRQGGVQSVNVGAEACRHPARIQHEFLHALGMYHEHTRPDRDNFITVHMQNIRWNMKWLFQKRKEPTCAETQVPYDHESLMHFGSRAFSRNGRATMTPKSGYDGSLGNMIGLTDKDSARLAAMYKCRMNRTRG